jgi:simple sugar transport system permease protein
MAVHFERSPVPGAVVVLGVSLLAMLGAFVVTGLGLWGYGMRFPHDYGVLLQNTLGDVRGLAEVLRKTIPLLLLGGGLVVAFRAQMWNIGAEGQMLAGAVSAAGVALFVPCPTGWLVPVMLLAGVLAGVLWSGPPALLKAYLGVNEVLTTLMMNYLAVYLVQWLIHGPWKGKSALGFAYSDPFPPAAWLPLLPGTRVHWPTLVLGCGVLLSLSVLLAYTRLGYEMRVLGANPEAARYAGINVPKVMLLAMGIAGGAAGLTGVGEVAGIHHKLLAPAQLSLGYGYTAILVAWLARGQPLAVLLTAPLIGFTFACGDVLKGMLRLPFQTVDVFNGLLLLCLIGTERLMGYRLHWSGKCRSAGSHG